MMNEPLTPTTPEQAPSLLPRWAWLTICILIPAFLALGGATIYFLTAEDDATTTSNVRPTPYPVHIAVENLPTATPTETPVPTATATLTPSPLPSSTPEPSSSAPTTLLLTETPQETAIAQNTEPTAQNSECQVPTGWVVYQVQEGDTLFAFELGAKHAGNPTTVLEILEVNCLPDTVLRIGQTLWLPEGAAGNAPSSQPSAPNLPAGQSRTPNCPCTLTIRDGWRVEEIADQINRTPVSFTGADFLAYVRKGAPIPARAFLSSVPSGAGLEGFMLPGTYTLQNDTTPEQFRDMVLDAFEASASGYLNQAANGLTPYEVVMLASIIQRESWDAHEQSLVSSVFHNRHNSGRAFGATVTIMYALGRQGNWWPRLQPGQTDLDTPYNTNIYAGFPPTAIASPSLSALQAAAQPAQTNYLYFTANCRGSGNVYAETYEEHLANVRCE